ncbi:hypothetical protein KIN20_018017 [Parelaphostrongylus tenuis]|uniref:Uncharacterized protein n=1 Tax=Parelaphostrongylus tenuis TaxID=148309 RepID=A0AAD5N706_PARTN|nr:hypothetical protein KIN20_018017 [Parelaphostrongylus tenuis]
MKKIFKQVARCALGQPQSLHHNNLHHKIFYKLLEKSWELGPVTGIRHHEQLIQEIDDLDLFTYDDIRSMEYLCKCTLKTLRLYPHASPYVCIPYQKPRHSFSAIVRGPSSSLLAEL